MFETHFVNIVQVTRFSIGRTPLDPVQTLQELNSLLH